MLKVTLAFVLLLVLLVIGLQLWRRADTRAADAAWAQLSAVPPTLPERFARPGSSKSDRFA